jgi:DNA-directed RNA polymerase specialized sigma24 family protein
VVLRDVFGLDYAEISRQLDIPQGTVKSRIHEGRRTLQWLLSR